MYSPKIFGRLKANMIVKISRTIHNPYEMVGKFVTVFRPNIMANSLSFMIDVIMLAKNVVVNFGKPDLISLFIQIDSVTLAVMYVQI